MGLYEQCFINLDKKITNDIYGYTNNSTGICVLSKNFYKRCLLYNPTDIFRKILNNNN